LWESIKLVPQVWCFSHNLTYFSIISKSNLIFRGVFYSDFTVFKEWWVDNVDIRFLCRLYKFRYSVCYHRCESTCRCEYFHGFVYDVSACNLFDGVNTERWRQLIFAWSKYELSPPCSFHVIHNLVEISTPASYFAPVMKLYMHVLYVCTCWTFQKEKKINMCVNEILNMGFVGSPRPPLTRCPLRKFCQNSQKGKCQGFYFYLNSFPEPFHFFF